MENGKLQMANDVGSRTERGNRVQDLSFTFAVHVIQFCRELKKIREYEIAHQLIKSGTSIGANIEEAQQAQSRPDFHAKMCIALKEAYESRYWLRLIHASVEIPLKQIPHLLKEAEELIRLLVAITKSTKKV